MVSHLLLSLSLSQHPSLFEPVQHFKQVNPSLLLELPPLALAEVAISLG